MVLDVEPHPLARHTSSVPLAHARSGKEAILAIVLAKSKEQSSRHAPRLENLRAIVIATQSRVPIRPELGERRHAGAPVVSAFLAEVDTACELSGARVQFRM